MICFVFCVWKIELNGWKLFDFRIKCVYEKFELIRKIDEFFNYDFEKLWSDVFFEKEDENEQHVCNNILCVKKLWLWLLKAVNFWFENV